MDGRTRRVARMGRNIGRVLLALLSAAVLAAAGYVWSVTGTLGHGVAASEAVRAPAVPRVPEAAFTALLVGLDSRTDTTGRPLPPDLLNELHAGDDEGQLNTDTIILLHVPAGPQPRAVAVSLPRDSFVEIAGDLGTHKINTAYRRGMADAERELAARGLPPAELERSAREAGRRSLVATVEDLTGVRVDHLAEINLAGFVEITDALGGVPVCLNAPVRESRSGIDLPAGRQVVQGPTALAFVRQRHGLDGGDLDRVGRQQAFLAGLTSTVMSSEVMREPARLNRVARAVGRYVVLDRGWNVQELVGQVRRLAAGELSFETIPTGTPALDTPVDGIAVEIDPDEVRAFVQARMPAADQAPVAPGATSAPTSALISAPIPFEATEPTTAPTSPLTHPPRSAVAAEPLDPAPTSGPRLMGPGRSAVPAPAAASSSRPTVTGTTSPEARTDSPPTTRRPITADGVPCVD